MFNSFVKRASLAALALGVGAGAAHAGTAYMDQQTPPVWWGAAGAMAILDIQYDPGATVPLVVKSIYIGEVTNVSLPQVLDNCGTPIKSGDSVVAHSLAPGQHCFLQSARIAGSNNLYGEIVVTDNSAYFGNMQTRVRAMLEVRDASNNVLSHVELR